MSKEFKHKSHSIRNLILFNITRLLWITCNLSGYAKANTNPVWQIPGHLTITEGESANITCHFQFQRAISYNNIVVKIKWRKDNGTEIRNETIHSNISFSVLPFKYLHKNQSGLYTCDVKMEIPLLFEGQGNGTYLFVTGKHQGPDIAPKTWVLALSVLIPLLVIVIAMTFRRYKRHNQAREHRTESNAQVAPQESTSQDAAEITYASINRQKINQRENQQRILERMNSGSQGQHSPLEEQVLYSAICLKQVD
ncbi:hypothetical protein ACEWY4_012095 [Coilia grayii]|uniref:Ig-like domain-containing protein n=1 Tax=Coilia grayii TaxID=363190 RepID=A0ABD1JZJ0_9TELE